MRFLQGDHFIVMREGYGMIEYNLNKNIINIREIRGNRGILYTILRRRLL